MAKRDNRKQQLVISVVIVFLMVMGFAGFMSNTTNSQKYNGKRIYKGDNFWYMKTNQGYIKFNYFPEQLEGINMSNDIKNTLLNSRVVYFTYDPDDMNKENIAEIEFDFNNIFTKNFGIYFVNGMTKQNEYNLSVITCENSTTVPVVYIKTGNETTIKNNNGCIILEGHEGRDFILLRDRLVYGLFGVIK